MSNKNSNKQQTIQLLLLPACLSEEHISFGLKFTSYCKLMMIPVLRSLALAAAAAAEGMIRALKRNWVSAAISNFITTANKTRPKSSMKRNLQGHCIHIFVTQTHFSCSYLPDVDWIVSLLRPLEVEETVFSQQRWRWMCKRIPGHTCPRYDRLSNNQ